MGNKFERNIPVEEIPSGNLDIFTALHMSDQTTQNGRRLCESFGDRDATNTRLYANCPFPGTRQGHEMNIDAREELSANWNQMLDGFSFIKTIYAPTKVVTLGDIYLISAIALSLPSYFFNKKGNPYGRHNELPSDIGVMYKTALGLIVASDAMIKSEEYQPEDIVTAEEVYDFAENNKLLFHKRKAYQQEIEVKNRACAASETQIKQVVETIVFPKRSSHIQSSLRTQLHNVNELLEFTRVYISYFKVYSFMADEVKKMRDDLLTALSEQQTIKGVESTFAESIKEYEEIESQFIADLDKTHNQVCTVLHKPIDAYLEVTSDNVQQILGVTPPKMYDAFLEAYAKHR